MNSPQGAEWPDWSGRTAVIVGTGPGASAVLMTEPMPIFCLAIKSTWRLVPWAHVLYGCDKRWWIENRGVPQFRGMKICPSPTVCKVYKDIRLVKLVAKVEIILTDTVGTIGCGLRTGGGHSGFHAINLAVQFGAKRIVLVGFDMTLRSGAHWRSDLSVAKPDAARVESWRVALDECAPQFERLGVDVINATPGSALTAYPKMPLRDAIHR